jgi:hypothetical protein
MIETGWLCVLVVRVETSTLIAERVAVYFQDDVF